MRAFSGWWMLGAWCRIVLVGCVACGGLAVDGPSPFASSGADPQLDTSGVVTAHPADADQELEPRRAAERSLQAGSSPVGQACGPLGEERQSLVVGDVQLQEDARCGAGNACLMRSPVDFDCRESVRSGAVECTPESVDLVPVPPRGSPQPTWQQDICTCRCDGSALDVEYCSCPPGMRCEPLIPSSGANAAARPYVGSYCVF
jgi:hypothetical protein